MLREAVTLDALRLAGLVGEVGGEACGLHEWTVTVEVWRKALLIPG